MYTCFHCGRPINLTHQTDATPPPDPAFNEPRPLPYSPVYVCTSCNVSWPALQGNSVAIQYPAPAADGHEYHPH